jgi:hypothetical protein
VALLAAAGAFVPCAASAQTKVNGNCYADDFLATVGNDQVFDVTISLWNHPDANERLQYEEVIQNFARGVYEMSNGVHKIRNVTIHQDGHQKRFSNVIWNHTAPGGSSPQALSEVGGILDDLGKVYFYDLAQDLNGNPDSADDIDMVRGSSDLRQELGFTLSHEWGHYAYSLGDEYTQDIDTTIQEQPITIMSVAQLAGSIAPAKADLQWLNFSTPQTLQYPSTISNTQLGMWQEKAWPFLVRTCANRSRAKSQASAPLITDAGEYKFVPHYPLNVSYSRLATVAPTTANSWTNPNDGQTYPSMKPDLYDNPSATDPLQYLKVTWIEADNVEMDLILDISGSMTGTPLQNVVTAAKGFVDGVPLTRTTLGVTTFETAVNINAVPLTPINTAADQTTAKNAISALTAGGNTAMFEGARQSLQKLTDYRTSHATNALQVVFLLSDGDDNASGTTTESQVLGLYKGAGVRMHTVGYADKDMSEAFFGPLQRLAEGTGGVFHHAITAVPDLQEAMRIALGDALSLQDVPFIDTGMAYSVDAVFDQFVFNVDYTLNTGGDVDFKVITPNGTTAARQVFTKSNPDGSFSATVIVDKPAIEAAGAGQWALVPTFLGAGGTLTHQHLFAVPGTQAPIELVTRSHKTSYVYPEPIEVYARTFDESSVTGLDVVATLKSPSGAVRSVLMNDDGTGNDAHADDGLYSGIVGDYTENGVYTLTVISSNSSGNGLVIVPHAEPGPDGENVNPTFVPLGKGFSRQRDLEFRVDGIVADDHGNDPATATTILPDYAEHPGKIETAGDRDFFRVAGVDTTKGLNVRLYGTNFGMAPKVSVYLADGTTLVTSGNAFTARSVGGYFSLAIPQAKVQEGQIIVVEDLNGNAGGTYTIDVGPPISADAPGPTQLKVESRDSNLNNTNISSVETRITNQSGRDIPDFKVVYYFDTEYFMAPVLEDWWSVKSAVRVVQRGSEQYAVEFDYKGYTLPNGATLPTGENSVGLHYSDWSTWNRSNDFSNNLSATFADNPKIAVFDAFGRLIYGQTPPVHAARTPVIDVVAWSQEDKLNDPAWTSPDIYIQNRGDDISNFTVYYYFTADNGQTPILADFSSPKAAVTLQNLGSSKYRIRYDYTGYTLPHLISSPGQSQTVVGIHYANYSNVNKTNDASENLSNTYKANPKIQIVDSTGKLIYGVANP